MRYDKRWLTLDEQVALLASRGLVFDDAGSCRHVLRTIGYYRLAGYLHPFRRTELVVDEAGHAHRQVTSDLLPGTTLEHAAALIDFDRRLRILVLDGVERIEVSLRTQLGHVLGRRSPFAHLDPGNFTKAFTDPIRPHPSGGDAVSRHAEWIDRVRERQAMSDETFVRHFRDVYDDEMPIWALTEILELGQLGRLYGGLDRVLASEIASGYGVPTKRMLASWLASINHVRNLSAHHARLFNRKLVTAPARPSALQIPLLGRMKDETTSKEVFGVYNVLAIMAFLSATIDPRCDWGRRARKLLLDLPVSDRIDVRSMGVPAGWEAWELWQT